MEARAITKLYKDAYPKLFRYANFKLQDKFAAEEVAANAFFKLLESEQKININSPRTWLWSTVKNMINEEFRKKYNKKQFDLQNTDDLANEIENDELKTEVMTKLRELKPEEQDIIILKIWEDMQFKEIAEVIGKKLSAVKFTYYQALEKLKVAMGERKHSKKLYVLTAPLLAGAIKETSSYYLPNTEVVERVFSNLVIKINTMTESATITSKGILSSMSPKLVGIIAAAVIGGTGLGVGTTVVLTKTAPTSTPVVTIAPTVETTVKPTKVTTTKPQDTVVPTVDPTANWKTYSNSQYGFEFKYPSDWELKVNDFPSQQSIDVSLSKDGYKFMVLVGPTGPELCIYDPSDTRMGIRFDGYKELSNSRGKYRRSWRNNSNEQTICYYNTKIQDFHETSEPGIITVTLPSGSSNSNYLDIMDKMILTYKNI